MLSVFNLLKVSLEGHVLQQFHYKLFTVASKLTSACFEISSFAKVTYVTL